MDSVLIHSPFPTNPPTFPFPSNSILAESIDRFLSAAAAKTLDFSAFRSIFSRLLQSTADPPLEVIWFYAAIAHHETIAKTPVFDRVTVARNLFYLTTACSSSSGGLKSIALLAPTISELYSCVLEQEKVEDLVEGVLSYVSICSGKWENFGTELMPCFLDLVKVWTVGKGKGKGKGSGVEEFFPLVGEGVRGKFKEEGCGIGYLAGVVMAEVFLLRMCLKVKMGREVRVSRKELLMWAVNSVTVFQNWVFFEILLRLLLEPKLPITSLLDSEGQNLLRDILYDVVILGNYSFLTRRMDMDQAYDFMRCIAIRKLIVTHDAIEIAREKGDHGKAISYINEFSSSSLPNQIVKWVTDQIGMQEGNKPDANTPHALLKWLVGFEEQGIRFSDEITPKLSELARGTVKVAISEVSMFNSESKQTEADYFFIDNKGDDTEEMQPMDTAFLAAAKSMRSPETNQRRKRKELGGEGESRTKFLKYKVHASSMKDYVPSPLEVDGMNSGSEVDNPSSEDGMDEN